MPAPPGRAVPSVRPDGPVAALRVPAVAVALALSLSLPFAAAGSAQPGRGTAGSPAAFVPSGQVVVAQVDGDLNGDGRPDRVLLIKGTDPARVVTHPERGRLDRNRRGLVIAFGAQGGLVPALVHRDCFSSENEDGGVYFAPELDVSIRNGTLRLHYAHGRYGYWAYTFRWQNGDFALIGYDGSENRGPVVERELSMNLSTRKARIRTNTNPAAEGGDERFRETWKTFALEGPIRLRDVADFDAFDVSRMLGPATR